MFDISWTEIMVVGVVALLVVGPKELPALLRTVGKYVGMIKRQASEFRAQFDEAMRDTEIDQIKKDIENVGRDMEQTVRDAERSVEAEMADAKREFDTAGEAASAGPAEASAADAGSGGPQAPSAVNGTGDHGVNGTASGVAGEGAPRSGAEKSP